MRQGTNDYEASVAEGPMHYENDPGSYAGLQMGVGQILHPQKPDMSKVESFATFGKQGSYTSLQNMNASQQYYQQSVASGQSQHGSITLQPRVLNQSSTDGSLSTHFSQHNLSPSPQLSIASQYKKGAAAGPSQFNPKIPRLPSKLESIDEENQRAGSQILLVADEQKTFKKFGSANRGSMLPSIPFGRVSKINNSKAVTSRLFQAS